MTTRAGGLRGVVLLLALGVAAWSGGHAAGIGAQAWLAQHLVRRAWDQTRSGAGDVRPWPWADTHPVARLLVPGQDVDLFVLAGASGRTMAFGPGHLSGTPLPGEAGNAVVSGHRDTHFGFLQRLRVGDAVLIEGHRGQRRRYVVRSTLVVDHRDTWVAEDTLDTRLTLVTCYPFDAIRPGGLLRYVVSAVLDSPATVRPASRQGRLRTCVRDGGSCRPEAWDTAASSSHPAKTPPRRSSELPDTRDTASHSRHRPTPRRRTEKQCPLHPGARRGRGGHPEGARVARLSHPLTSPTSLA